MDVEAVISELLLLSPSSLSLPTLDEVIFALKFLANFFPDMLKLNRFMLSSSQKHNMEPKYVIGLALQRSKHRRSQKFGLGAAQKRNIQTQDHNV